MWLNEPHFQHDPGTLGMPREVVGYFSPNDDDGPKVSFCRVLETSPDENRAPNLLGFCLPAPAPGFSFFFSKTCVEFYHDF